MWQQIYTTQIYKAYKKLKQGRLMITYLLYACCYKLKRMSRKGEEKSRQSPDKP